MIWRPIDPLINVVIKSIGHPTRLVAVWKFSKESNEIVLFFYDSYMYIIHIKISPHNGQSRDKKWKNIYVNMRQM